MKNTFFIKHIPLLLLTLSLFVICVGSSCCSVASHSVFTLDSAQVKHMHFEKSDTLVSHFKK